MQINNTITDCGHASKFNINPFCYFPKIIIFIGKLEQYV